MWSWGIRARGKKNPVRVVEKKKRSQQDRRFFEPWNSVYQRPDAWQAQQILSVMFYRNIGKTTGSWIADFLRQYWPEGNLNGLMSFYQIKQKSWMDFMWSLIYCALKSESFLEQLFQSVWNWRGWGVERGGLTFYITPGKDCEMLFLPGCAEREVPSACLLCHSPAALESCLAVGTHGLTCSKWSVDAERGISALRSFKLPRAGEAAWIVPALGCLGQCSGDFPVV